MASFSDARVVCRPALRSDTDDVLAFTRSIWEGRDYIHLVWRDWLADPLGLLISAQFGRRVVGIAKMTPLVPGQWWLHGLRVDPAFQGRGIGSHIHEYLDAWWLKHGSGTVRLMTSTKRVNVHHLCERTGYSLVGEIVSYRRFVRDERSGRHHASADFSRTGVEEVPDALGFARDHLPFIDGLMETGWRMVRPDETSLAAQSRAGHLHWWRGHQGLVATFQDSDDDGPVLGIGFAALSEAEQLADLLCDVPSLTHGLGVEAVLWHAPTDRGVLSALERAGYSTDEDSAVIFSKEHPEFKQPARIGG